MKIIETVPIWDNGTVQEAKILNSYGTNTALGLQATFYYSLLSMGVSGSVGSQLTQGNLTMSGEDYQNWGDDDDYAWDWVAEQLNLTITEDYIPPSPQP